MGGKKKPPGPQPGEKVYVRSDGLDYGEKTGLMLVVPRADGDLKLALEFQAKPHELGSYPPLPTDVDVVAAGLRKLAEWLSPTKKPRKPVVIEGTPRAELVRMVWALYVRVFDRQRSKLDDKRKVIIGRALDAGYTPLDCEKCFLGYRSSEWHMGKNDRHKAFIDIELLLRDAKHIDEGLDYYEKNCGPDTPSGGPRGGKKAGGRPEDRWVDGAGDGAAGGGGLPQAGPGPAKGAADSGSVAPGADAGKLREAGAGDSLGLPFR